MSASILYLGMDVHKDSITVAAFGPTGNEPRLLEKLPNETHRIRRFVERLRQDGSELRACYEASGAGYVLHRQFTAWGIHCDVIAPSLIPTRPGEKRKHDKRDALGLGRLYRAGELVPIRIPSEAEERVRDLVRCRATFQKEIQQSRHYLLKFLRRRGFLYREGEHWTQRHFAWMRSLLHEKQKQLVEEDALVFSEYLALLEYKLSRREELDGRIEEIALRPFYRPVVERLKCFRGIETHAAMVLASEIGDWRRFESPRQLMTYLGLVPSEESSGDYRRQGRITKSGNSHCRHVLVQAAWSYRRPPTRGAALKRRQQGQPSDVIAHSWKAQQRLYKLFHRIGARKASQIAVVAVARELVGFLWAVMQGLDLVQQGQQKNAA